jgi:regulator of replication initiation timing
MTSVLYGGGLNYQMGNPVRQEIVTVRRELDSLRKQVEQLTEENIVYRKHIMKLLQKDVEGGGDKEFTKDLMSLATGSSNSSREPGGGTVQGAGFRR